MKKKIVAMIVAGAMIASMAPAMSAYAEETEAAVSEAPDYSREECWYQIPEITKDVDTIFVYQTEYKSTNEGDPDYAPIDSLEMQEGVKNIDHKNLASVFEESTNLFIPYYRQASLQNLVDTWKETEDIRTALTGIPYDDITAALDYYFENYNNGRPFILAGHSQGSAICTLVLQNYFKEHPEYYDRMVVAYVIGFSVTKDELEANPHLRFASGESDTGVIVSWDVEGSANVEADSPATVHLPNAISINPLNWKLDETYASANENLGSFVLNEETGEYEICDVGADAQVNTVRGTVVTNTEYGNTSNAELFGPQSFHEDDYGLYYNNIKDNVTKRIASYQANSSETEKEETESASKSAHLLADGYQSEDPIFQVALLQSLAQGYFDGIATVSELKEHGDTGIGTFDGLNGEMIVLDGVVYRAAGDGTIQIPDEDETIPFSNVTFFEEDLSVPLSGVKDMEDLQSQLNAVVAEHGDDLFYMVKIPGSFSSIKVRSEDKQEEPYRELHVALAADQKEYDYSDIKGTMVGLYCPNYMGDLNSVGWHFHFISEDLKLGGHVLRVSIDEATAQMDAVGGFEMYVPAEKKFQDMELSKDMDEAIHKAETATSGNAKK